MEHSKMLSHLAIEMRLGAANQERRADMLPGQEVG
jgi:hypothetical protein